ncbi:MAG: hypothetical protein ACLFMP_00825 [Desulfonatronovibrionaceae bacterium]
MYLPEDVDTGDSLLQEGLYMLVLVFILIIAAFAAPGERAHGLWLAIYEIKWVVTGVLAYCSRPDAKILV